MTPRSNAKSDNILFSPEIFNNNQGRHIDERKLFLSCFKEIPDTILELNIEVSKFIPWFEAEYKEEIWDKIYTKRDLSQEDLLPTYDDCYFFLDADLLVYCDSHEELIKLLFKKTNDKIVDTLHLAIRKFKLEENKLTSQMDIIYAGRNGLRTDSFDLKDAKCNLHLNYNDDFIEHHNTIVKRLNTQDDKGIVLLHGEPGTGKTTYIRHLISLTDKKILFVPPHIASSITGPELMGLLLDYPNSILIIEDAENLILDRNNYGSSPVSALLNISDGLLSDCLFIQIICSFNTHLSKIDKALLRKGRLIAKYEFTPLETEKANQLSKSLRYENVFTEPQILTDVYNQEERTVVEKRAAVVGFR